MTGSLATSTSRDVSNERSSRQADIQQYPSLKKSLSASLSLSSRSPSRSKGQVRRDDEPAIEGQEDGHPRSPEATKANRPMSLRIPKQAPAAEVALKALKYLPTPLVVLSSIKTIVLANEAMGRLLGLSADRPSTETQNERSGEITGTSDVLLGLSLSQIGVDMMQAGQRIWVSWEASVVPKKMLVLTNISEIPR